jgi:hypothetical protein
MSSLFVLKQDSMFSLDMLSSHLWFEFGLSANQTQSQGLSWLCFYSWCFTVAHLHAFGLTNTFALFIQHMSPSSWNILISLLLSPSMTFLSSPWSRSSCWTFGTNIGNFWEPTSCHREVCALDVGRVFLWFTCTCWKMLPWILLDTSLVSIVSCPLSLPEVLIISHIVWIYQPHEDPKF